MIKCHKCDFENPDKNRFCSSCGFELPKKQEIKEELEESKVEKKTSFKKLVSAALLAVIAFTITFYLLNDIAATSSTYDKAMMRVASEINESCPIMIDSETRLDNAISLPDNIFQYNYTLMSLNAKNSNLDELRNELSPVIINSVKTSPDMQIMRDHETTVNYYYRDIEGNHLFTISVRPELYGE